MNVGLLGSVNLSLDKLTCSHRLYGLPSSSGSISPLQLGALPPQNHSRGLSWPGTVEPQPPQNRHYTYQLFESLSHTRKPLFPSIDRYWLFTQALIHDDATIVSPENNSLRPVKIGPDEKLTEPFGVIDLYTD